MKDVRYVGRGATDAMLLTYDQDLPFTFCPCKLACYLFTKKAVVLNEYLM